MEASERSLLILGGTSVLIQEMLSSLEPYFQTFWLIYERERERAQRTAEQLEQHGKKVHICSFHQTDLLREHIFQAVIIAQGIPVHLSPLFLKTEEDFEAQWRSQLLVTHRVLKVVLPNLAKNSRSLIVGVITKAIMGVPLMADYIAAKCALSGYLDAIASEYGKKNVHVAKIHPDFFPSSLTAAWPKIGPYESTGKVALQNAREQLRVILKEFIGNES